MAKAELTSNDALEVQLYLRQKSCKHSLAEAVYKHEFGQTAKLWLKLQWLFSAWRLTFRADSPDEFVPQLVVDRLGTVDRGGCEFRT